MRPEMVGREQLVESRSSSSSPGPRAGAALLHGSCRRIQCTACRTVPLRQCSHVAGEGRHCNATALATMVLDSLQARCQEMLLRGRLG